MPEKTCLYRKRSVSESLSFIIDRLEDNEDMQITVYIISDRTGHVRDREVNFTHIRPITNKIAL